MIRRLLARVARLTVTADGAPRTATVAVGPYERPRADRGRGRRHPAAARRARLLGPAVR